MPYKPIQIRAKNTSGKTKVRALIKHPMTRTGPLDSKEAGSQSSHYIQELTCFLQEKIVMSAFWGESIARDPLVGFTFKGGMKGDVIQLVWVDNQGQRGSVKTVIT